MLGIRLVECADDGADHGPTLALPPGDHLAGRPGMLHGGAIAGLIDMAAQAALGQQLVIEGRAPAFKQIGMTIDYLRGGRQQTCLARGRVTRIGRRVATVIVDAWQGDDRTQIAGARFHMLLRSDDADD